MISLSTCSGSSRKLILLTGSGFILFLLFQAIFNDEGHYLPSWSDFNALRISDPDRNATLAVAEKIYVLSLPHRSDRRQEMDKLKAALGLRWTYVDAMDTKNKLVGRILDSVWVIRATNDYLFTWPADMPPPNERISPWSPGFLSIPDIAPGSRPSDPMVCATENNTVASYDLDLPEVRILTPARVACWYSHLSVIEKVANDRSLKNDDVVIVLEDDLDMERDIHTRLRHVWTSLPKDWDMVYFGMEIS